jgi:hypothetical protein
MCVTITITVDKQLLLSGLFYICIYLSGHTLGGACGLAFITAPLDGQVVNKKFLEEGKWEAEIAGKRYPIRLSLNPMYDPNNKKIKA